MGAVGSDAGADAHMLPSDSNLRRDVVSTKASCAVLTSFPPDHEQCLILPLSYARDTQVYLSAARLCRRDVQLERAPGDEPAHSSVGLLRDRRDRHIFAHGWCHRCAPYSIA